MRSKPAAVVPTLATAFWMLFASDVALADFPYKFAWEGTVTTVAAGSYFETVGIAPGSQVAGVAEIGGAEATADPQVWNLGPFDVFEGFKLAPPLEAFPGEYGIFIFGGFVQNDANLLGTLYDNVRIYAENQSGFGEHLRYDLEFATQDLDTLLSNDFPDDLAVLQSYLTGSGVVTLLGREGGTAGSVGLIANVTTIAPVSAAVPTGSMLVAAGSMTLLLVTGLAAMHTRRRTLNAAGSSEPH